MLHFNVNLHCNLPVLYPNEWCWNLRKDSGFSTWQTMESSSLFHICFCSVGKPALCTHLCSAHYQISKKTKVSWKQLRFPLAAAVWCGITCSAAWSPFVYPNNGAWSACRLLCFSSKGVQTVCMLRMMLRIHCKPLPARPVARCRHSHRR